MSKNTSTEYFIEIPLDVFEVIFKFYDEEKNHYDILSPVSSFVFVMNFFYVDGKCELNWIQISEYCDLSEEFIEKYKDKVSWQRISRNQKLSHDFIHKFRECIDFEQLLYNKKVEKTEKFVLKYRMLNKIDSRYMYKYKALVNWQKDLEKMKNNRKIEFKFSDIYWNSTSSFSYEDEEGKIIDKKTLIVVPSERDK